jgi:hypothetical protein
MFRSVLFCFLNLHSLKKSWNKNYQMRVNESLGIPHTASASRLSVRLPLLFRGSRVLSISSATTATIAVQRF